MPTQADEILADVYDKLGLGSASDEAKYSKIVNIVAELQKIHETNSINVGTTGTISERVCRLGIDAVPDLKRGIRPFGPKWRWVGDFLLPGHPYDIAVSVKSFKAKERLLASGTGSLLTPTIGWGLFNDPKEWSEERARAYLYRGFVSIYMPRATLASVSSSARRVQNINGRLLLRAVDKFSSELRTAISHGNNRIDVRAL